ncbi:MAG: hypothetical protein HQK60_12790 [Deltaproteobacteria bacterium]|nr:hypothetical protein [Deltaproteobacteria bacterium]
MDKRLALLTEYVTKLQQAIDDVKDILPNDVQEAYDVIFRMLGILADPSNSDQTIQEALFDKVPREKIEWAIKVLDDWHTKDERKALAREKERSRRQRNGGMAERKLTKDKIQELYENFETMRILDAVDILDQVRGLFSDQFNGKGVPRPPELRDKLLELHTKAHEIINGEYYHKTDMDMFDLAWEIEDEVSEAIDKLEQLRQVISDLTNLTPADDEEDS